MTHEELIEVVKSLAVSVVKHDDQIEELIGAAKEQGKVVDGLLLLAEKHAAEMASLQKEWQAYLCTIRPQ
jgi:predicted amino acid racemase